jgi:hypothetical protein
MTSSLTSRRKCGGSCPFRHRQDHCAFRLRECTEISVSFARSNVSAHVAYLLGIHRSLQLCHIISLSYRAQENWLELIHTSIREEKGRVIVGNN